MSKIVVNSITHSGNTGTENLTLDNSGNVTVSGNLSVTGTVPGETAKAWVHYDQKTSMSILDSYNVSSVTDVAAGEATVNFTNNMANANYVVAGTSSEATTGTGHFDAINFHSFTTSALDVETFGTPDDPALEKDNDMNCVIVFGDT